MERINRIVDLLGSNKRLAIAAGTFLALAAIKLYFRGAVCRVNRDLTGKVIVVTGGNSGIGRETIEALSSQDCTIIFGARDRERSEKVVESVSRRARCKLLYFHLDLSDKRSIENFSQQVKKECQRVDILINNAGLYAPKQRTETKDGFQTGMGVNHLGHFYLTYLLWSHIKSAPRPRIINVSSGAHKGFFLNKYKGTTQIDFQDFNFTNNYSSNASYSRSKLANILFAKQLQKRLDEAGIEVFSFSLHPGVVNTQIIYNSGVVPSKLLILALTPVLFLFTKTPSQGAQTTLHVALQDQKLLEKGGYYVDCKAARPSKAVTAESATKLWEISEKSLGIKFDV